MIVLDGTCLWWCSFSCACFRWGRERPILFPSGNKTGFLLPVGNKQAHGSRTFLHSQRARWNYIHVLMVPDLLARARWITHGVVMMMMMMMTWWWWDSSNERDGLLDRWHPALKSPKSAISTTSTSLAEPTTTLMLTHHGGAQTTKMSVRGSVST